MLSVGQKKLPIATARIRAIQYSPMSDAAISEESRCRVSTSGTFTLGIPKSGGVFDQRLGTIAAGYICGSCFRDHSQCTGHYGNADLGCKIISPIMLSEVGKWLKIVCHNCGALVATPEERAEMRKMAKSARIAWLVARVGSGSVKTRNVRICLRCKAIHSSVSSHPKQKFVFIAKRAGASGGTEMATIYAHNIAEIFSRVSVEDVEFMDRDQRAHPSVHIQSQLFIPPVGIRPDGKKPGGHGTTDDPLTTSIRSIMDIAGTQSRQITPTIISHDYANMLSKINGELHEMHLGSNDRRKSISLRLKGKGGRFRENILGRRVFGMARSTIYGLPRLRTNQITIPLFIAQTLRINEVIQPYNRARLSQFIANGARVYPGCYEIISPNGIRTIAASSSSYVEDGSIISRDLVTGDFIGFNRQPTLTPSSITMMEIIVDPVSLAIGMSPLSCSLFNADFDGDQMNGIGYTLESSINEQRFLTGVDSHMVSHATGGIAIGQMGDSIMGLAKLTQSGVAFDKYHACLLFNTTQITPDFSAIGNAIDGRAVASTVLPPINFRGVSSYYSKSAPWASWMTPAESDEKIIIEDGVLKSGCLDKACLGAGHKSLYQASYNEIGAARTLEYIFNMQQIGINYISQIGFTTGIRDFIMPPEFRDKIMEASRTIESRGLEIVEQLNRGAIIPPIDKTVQQYYEEMQIAAQRAGDEYTPSIVMSIKHPRTNGAFEMMASGCKGQFTFLVNMRGAVGTIIIDRQRVPLSYGHWRTLPYFQRYDESPRARGFVETSFMKGLSLAAQVFNAMMARVDVNQRALMTSVTGDQNRKSEKSLETIIVTNHRACVKDHNIISFAYGGDFFDPRRLEYVSYEPALMSDDEFALKYKAPFTAAPFEREFSALSSDRARYRSIFLNLESVGAIERVDGRVRMPFNARRVIDHIISTIIRAESACPPIKPPTLIGDTADDIAPITERVDAFCDELPYLFANEQLYKARAWLPEYVRGAAGLLSAYIRSELCTTRIIAIMKDARSSAIMRRPGFIDAIIEAIRMRIISALVDPGTLVGVIASQSFSEPLTQNLLDSYKLSALGISKRYILSKCQEAMSATPVAKLSNPVMTVMLNGEFAHDEHRAREIANHIEMLQLNQIVSRWECFYETFGNPTHPEYKHESAMIAQSAESMSGLSSTSDLIPWCIRYELDRIALVQKNISVLEIVTALRDRYKDIYIAFTTEKNAVVVIRIYIRASGLKKFEIASASIDKSEKTPRRRGTTTADRILVIHSIIFATIIRGIDGIRRAQSTQIVRSRADSAGSIISERIWCVRTTGTNIIRTAAIPGVNPNMITTDAIQEIASVLGIGAAWRSIITEMRGLVDSCDVRHYMIYADEMTRTGRVTSIERSGVSSREMNNVALRAGNAASVQVLTDAAIHARRDNLSGMSGQLFCGSVPLIGTMYNQVAIDADVIARCKKTAEQELADI